MFSTDKNERAECFLIRFRQQIVRGRELNVPHGQKQASKMQIHEILAINCPWEMIGCSLRTKPGGQNVFLLDSGNKLSVGDSCMFPTDKIIRKPSTTHMQIIRKPPTTHMQIIRNLPAKSSTTCPQLACKKGLAELK